MEFQFKLSETEKLTKKNQNPSKIEILSKSLKQNVFI